MATPAWAERPEATGRPVAVVLLLLQAGSSLLTAVGGFVFARIAEPTAAWGGLLSLGLAAVLVTLSVGVARGRSWARGLAIVGQVVGLAGTAFTVAIHQGPTGVTSFTNDVALPLLVIWALR